MVYIRRSYKIFAQAKRVKKCNSLRKTCLLAFKLWSLAIRGKLRNLITQSTFSIEDAKPNDVITPTTYVFKIKSLSDSSWDKAKARCCVCGDLQCEITNEDTWSVMANKKTLRIFLMMVYITMQTMSKICYINLRRRLTQRSS